MALNGKLLAIGIPIGAVVVVVIGLVWSSLSKLNSYDVGLKYDTIWKKLDDDAEGEGLHLGPPGFEFIVFPSVFKTLEFFGLSCINKDGVPIVMDVSYQYRAQPKELKQTIMAFKDHDGYTEVLEYAGKSAILESCSLFNTTQFQTERGIFQERVGQNLVERYDELYCDVSEIQVNNIARPSGYESAIKQKETARENIKVAENERPRLITQAETLKKEAETQAEITVQKARSDARIINNKALTEAQSILNQFDKEGDVYVNILGTGTDSLKFSKEGFLSYIGVRAIANAKNPVYVGLKSPAKTSYVTN